MTNAHRILLYYVKVTLPVYRSPFIWSVYCTYTPIYSFPLIYKNTEMT